MKLKVAVLAFFVIVVPALADSLTDTNTTSDAASAAVNAGAGQIFTCSGDPGDLSCTDPAGFTCYGVANCAALDVVTASGPLDPPPAPVPTPEPDALALALCGVIALIVRRRARTP